MEKLFIPSSNFGRNLLKYEFSRRFAAKFVDFLWRRTEMNKAVNLFRPIT